MMNMVSWKLTLVRDRRKSCGSGRTVKAPLIAATPSAEVGNCHRIRRVSGICFAVRQKNRKVSGIFFTYFNIHAR